MSYLKPRKTRFSLAGQALAGGILTLGNIYEEFQVI